MRHLIVPVFLLAAIAGLTSCGRESTRPHPTIQISGSVVLELSLMDAHGAPLGVTRGVPPDSVQVYILCNGALTDSTRTINGRYQFTGVSGATYQTAVGLWPCLSDTTRPLSASTDTAIADTLSLRRTGDIRNFPNPCDPWHNGSQFSFVPDDDGWATVSIHTLQGAVVRTLETHTYYSAGTPQYFAWGIIGGPSSHMPPGYYLLVVLIGPDSQHSQVRAIEPVLFQHSRMGMDVVHDCRS
jgi:hypothetical protein